MGNKRRSNGLVVTMIGLLAIIVIATTMSGVSNYFKPIYTFPVMENGFELKVVYSQAGWKCLSNPYYTCEVVNNTMTIKHWFWVVDTVQVSQMDPESELWSIGGTVNPIPFILP